jgi:DNA-directed RNA polymerase delta subunit
MESLKFVNFVKSQVEEQKLVQLWQLLNYEQGTSIKMIDLVNFLLTLLNLDSKEIQKLLDKDVC